VLMRAMPAFCTFSPHCLILAMVSRDYKVIRVSNNLHACSCLRSFCEVYGLMQFVDLFLIDVSSDVIVEHRVAELFHWICIYREYLVEFQLQFVLSALFDLSSEGEF